jgi:hypothetical protein
MSKKISELAAATSIANADLLTAVQGGVNKRLTRAELFLGGATEAVTLSFNGASLMFSAGGQAILQGSAGNICQIAGFGGGAVWVDGAGGIRASALGGADMILQANSGSFQIDVAGNITVGGPGAVFVGYVDGSGGSWGGAGAPTNLGTAVDRLAVAVAGLLGGPIP